MFHYGERDPQRDGPRAGEVPPGRERGASPSTRRLRGEPPSARRLSPGRKLAVVIAAPVVLIGFVFMATFPDAGRMLPTVFGGLMALAGGVYGRPEVLLIAFAVGFLPFKMGPYLLLVGWHATWVGVCELLYLVAAGMIVRERSAAGGPA